MFCVRVALVESILAVCKALHSLEHKKLHLCNTLHFLHLSLLSLMLHAGLGIQFQFLQAHVTFFLMQVQAGGEWGFGEGILDVEDWDVEWDREHGNPYRIVIHHSSSVLGGVTL